MRRGAGSVDPSASISSPDASMASIQPEIVSVIVYKVLTLDSASFAARENPAFVTRCAFYYPRTHSSPAPRPRKKS